MAEFGQLLQPLISSLVTDREIVGEVWAMIFAVLTAGIFKFALPPIERRWPALAPHPGGVAKLRLGVLAIFGGAFVYVITR